MTTKDEVICCDGCCEKFGSAEKRIDRGNEVYHEHCDKKRDRTTRIHEFFLTDRGAKGIVVVPRGTITGRNRPL